MKKELIVLLVLFAVLFAMPPFFAIPILADGGEIYYSTYLILDSEVSSSLEIIRQPGASIDYVKAELYFFPKDDERQTVLDIKTEPEATPSQDKFVFNWKSPGENLLRYKVESSVRVENKFEKVYNKISFPITGSLPADVSEYINPTEKIDSGNKNIVSLANSLAEGEDDLFIVIHKLAAWVKENVGYSLTTVTAEATQKASWVLENREGVCDEITALFMAMCRALGIPAMFVSGVSYTDDPQFAERWGPHGWSEVYLPGYGWVPFDVTYGELGWIDPSHIKLSESIDPDKPSGKLEWKGSKFDIKAGKFDLSAAIKETGGRILDTVEITANVLKKEVGFGSYNLVEADIRNLRDYYVTTDISLSAPEDVEIDGKQNQQIILKPGETEKVFWILKISQNLDRKYVYTFPALAYNQRNTSDKTEFKAAYKETVYSYDEISTLLSHLEEGEEKAYSKELEFNCNAANDEFYVYEENSIICVLENKGNTALKDLNVCFNKECKSVDVMIAQKADASFDIKEVSGGVRDLIITAKNSEVSKTSYVPVTVLDIPNVTIAELNYPAELKYRDKGSIEFNVMKESFSDLYDVKVRVKSKRVRNEWRFDSLNETRKFILDFSANDLAAGDNDFSVIVDYEDKNSKEYSTKKDFKIKLTGLTFFQKIMVKVKGIGFFIANLF